jgi:uncharacterized protein YwgA
MMDSLSKSRIAILARMVSQAREKKLGRTQVMKLFYFLQELKEIPLGYDFRLFTYGPFDSEVLSDLATACSLNVVSEKTMIYSRGYGYDITPGSHAYRLGLELETSNPSIAAQVDAVVRDFGTYGAADLELLSTIFFVDREFSKTGTEASDEALAERVRQIKPHFTMRTILHRINEMAEKGWLRCLIKKP